MALSTESEIRKKKKEKHEKILSISIYPVISVLLRAPLDRDGLQFGGNAQAITKGRWLHHTSFLWAFEPENMRYLRMPDKKASSPPIPREHSTGLPAASACWKKRCIADWRWVGSSACALPSWREEKMTKDQRTTARGVAFTTNDPRPCPLRSCVASERGLRGFFLRGVRGLSACVADAMQRVY